MASYLLDAIALLVLVVYVDLKQKIYVVASSRYGFVLLGFYAVLGTLFTHFAWPYVTSQFGAVPVAIGNVVYWHSFFVLFNLHLRPRRLEHYLLGSTVALLFILVFLGISVIVLLTNSLAFTTTNDRFYQRVFWQIGLVGCFLLLVPIYEIPGAIGSDRGVQE